MPLHEAERFQQHAVGCAASASLSSLTMPAASLLRLMERHAPPPCWAMQTIFSDGAFAHFLSVEDRANF